MRDDKKQARHEAITDAAYALLAQKGYDGTSMLSIAKAAKASNETLYNWYGDKRGLFEVMVRDNAAHSQHMLESALKEQTDPRQTLEAIAPVLLGMLVGERAILLNRAAASDPSGTLGAAISKGGRDVIQPLIGAVIVRLVPHTGAQRSLTHAFVGLLIGDLQIKRVIGVLPEFSQDQIDQRCAAALEMFHVLAGTFSVGPETR